MSHRAVLRRATASFVSVARKTPILLRPLADAPLRLSPLEALVAERIDGRTTIEELAEGAGISMVEAERLVSRLAEEGLVAIAERTANLSGARRIPSALCDGDRPSERPTLPGYPDEILKSERPTRPSA